MSGADHLTRDIARKCGDDVEAAIKRNMALVDTPEAKLSVSLSAAASAMGAASGSYLTMHDARDQPPVHHLAAADGVWRSLRPMVLKVMADIHAMKGIEEPEWFPSPNPFALVDILPADRDALYGGLISAGHPAHYARHMAYDMPGDDGSLQMLARHRLAYTGPPADTETVRRCAEIVRDRAVTLTAKPLGGGSVSQASRIAARHLITAAEEMERSLPVAAAPAVDAVPASVFPAAIGRVYLGERRSDGERLCSHGHPVPAGHPLYWPEQISPYDDSDPLCLTLYWPEQISQYDDSDPLCLMHAIDQLERDNADFGEDYEAVDSVPAGEVEPCRFVDCPPGLFRWNGLLCFKSEYSTKAGQPDAYCVDSGEYFWGGTSGDLEKRRNLIVKPVAFATLSHGEGRT